MNGSTSQNIQEATRPPVSISKLLLTSLKQRTPPIPVHPYDENHPMRPDIEAFIKHVYWRHHAAKLHYFMPTLLASWGKEVEGPLAAVGLRGLQENPIFLEQYLSVPIEQTLREFDSSVTRAHIAEIGNLACISSRISPLMIVAVAHFLAEQQRSWAVFTGTKLVRLILARAGLDVIEIKRAEGHCLGGKLHDWGTYYEQNPFVMAVRVSDALRIFSQSYAVEKEWAPEGGDCHELRA